MRNFETEMIYGFFFNKTSVEIFNEKNLEIFLFIFDEGIVVTFHWDKKGIITKECIRKSL